MIIVVIKLTAENQNSITMFAHLLNKLNLVGVNQAKLEKWVKILKLALMRPIKLNNKIGFTLLSLWLLFFFHTVPLSRRVVGTPENI